MKLIAQSLVPTKAPYIHLGYTAATMMPQGPTGIGGALSTGLGLSLMLGAFALVVRAALGKRGPNYAILFRRLRQALYVAAAGLGFLFVAVLLAVAANGFLADALR